MSYSIYTYLIALDQLRALYGCNDTTLIAEIEQRHAAAITELNTWIQEDWKSAAPTINQVIHATIAGSFLWPYDEAPYKEVLQLYCQHIGEALPNDQFIGLGSHGLRFLEEDPHMGVLFFQTAAPVHIPGIEEEKMYRIGHISPAIAEQFLKERTPPKSRIRHDDAEETWETGTVAQFYGRLVAAVQKQKTIITFFV